MKGIVGDKTMAAIWSEYTRRLTTSSHAEPYSRTKSENAKYFLAREVYALGMHIYAYPPKGWTTKDILTKVRSHLNRPEKTGDVFHDLLMSVFEDDMQLDRRERWQVAQELEYARRHNIPAELVCGFLLQSGPRSEVPRKLKDDYREPAFRDPPDED